MAKAWANSGVRRCHEKESAWTVVVADKNGAEVFRDSYANSASYPVAVTWLSAKDQVWILSSDVGTAHIEAGPDGKWTEISKLK